jgi:hypothetical protein
MEDFLRAMQSHVNGRQSNHSRAGEYQEAEAVFFGFRGPGMSLLQILEAVDSEEELGNRQEKHDAEEDTRGLLVFLRIQI